MPKVANPNYKTSSGIYIVFSLILLLYAGCNKETIVKNRIDGLWQLVEVKDSTGLLSGDKLTPFYYEFYKCNREVDANVCDGLILVKHLAYGDFTVKFEWAFYEGNVVSIKAETFTFLDYKGYVKFDGRTSMTITKPNREYLRFKKVKEAPMDY
jgi:hypothetical protein